MLKEIEGFVKVKGSVDGGGIAQNESEDATHIELLSARH
jgi:hypothetical protein